MKADPIEWPDKLEGPALREALVTILTMRLQCQQIPTDLLANDRVHLTGGNRLRAIRSQMVFDGAPLTRAREYAERSIPT